jgi:excisionase family DNA binding protein
MSVTTKIKKIFCTSREAAVLLGISTGTVQAWVDNGLLSAWRTAGGHRRISRESVLKLLSTETSSTEIGNPRVINQCITASADDVGLEQSAVMERTRSELVHLDKNVSLDDGLQILEIFKCNPMFDKMMVVVVGAKN